MPDLAEEIREFIDSGATPVTAQEIVETRNQSLGPTSSLIWYRRSRRLNTYAIGAAAMATAICVLVVMLVFASTPSSTQTVISPPRPSSVPASWQMVSFGGLTMYVPGNWPVGTERSWGDCGLTSQPFFKDNSVELDTGATAVVFHCPSIPPIPPGISVPSVNGLLVDPGPNGPLPDASGFTKRLRINDLLVDPASGNYGGLLVLAVSIPGRPRPVAVEIGLAGGGKVAHAILYSMRASASDADTNTATTRSAAELPMSCTTNPSLLPVSPTPTWPSGYRILDAVPNALSIQYPTVFGGIVQAHATPGEGAVQGNSHFVILETARDPRLEAEATSAYPKPLTVTFRLSPRSFACITAVQASVEASTRGLQAAGIDMIGVGQAPPFVVVSVTTCGPEAERNARAWFADRWGGAVQVTTCAKVAIAGVAQSRR
jgi:hypothetical protein